MSKAEMNEIDKEKEENENAQLLKDDSYLQNSSDSIDDIISKGYLTFYPILVTISVILILIADGLSMVLVSLLIIPIQGKFNLTNLEMNIIVASIFLGVALGSLSVTFLSNRFKRTTLIKIFLATLLLFHLLAVAYSHSIWFSACRVLAGYSLGVLIPMLINIFGEYLPTKLRGIGLIGMWAFFGIGQILLGGIILGEMPNFESKKLTKVILYSAIPLLIAFVSSLFTLYDSPRNLILKNNYEEAFTILQSMNFNVPINEKEQKNIISQVVGSLPQERKSSILDLFSPEFRMQTILLSFIMLGGATSLYGILNISNLTMKELHIQDDIFEYKDIIIEQILMATFSIIALVCIIIYSEFSSLGRKGISGIFSMLTGIFYIFSIIFPQAYYLFLIIGFSTTIVFINVINTYFVEVYPTWIRDTSSSFIFMMLRLFSLLCQFVYLNLFKVNYKIDYYVTGVIGIICGIFIFLLPGETHGKNLDSGINNINEKNKAQ